VRLHCCCIYSHTLSVRSCPIDAALDFCQQSRPQGRSAGIQITGQHSIHHKLQRGRAIHPSSTVTLRGKRFWAVRFLFGRYYCKTRACVASCDDLILRNYQLIIPAFLCPNGHLHEHYHIQRLHNSVSSHRIQRQDTRGLIGQKFCSLGLPAP
jgi:hypothetical protein